MKEYVWIFTCLDMGTKIVDVICAFSSEPRELDLREAQRHYGNKAGHYVIHKVLLLDN